MSDADRRLGELVRHERFSHMERRGQSRYLIWLYDVPAWTEGVTLDDAVIAALEALKEDE